MTSDQIVLAVYGAFNLAYGILIGIALANVWNRKDKK